MASSNIPSGLPSDAGANLKGGRTRRSAPMAVGENRLERPTLAMSTFDDGPGDQ